MAIRTVSLALIAQEERVSEAAVNYALALCEQTKAHLCCRIIPPLLDLPTARILPLAHALVDQVNAERMAAAEKAREHIETAARLSGVPTETRILHMPYLEARDAALDAARASDVVVLEQAAGALSEETGLIEGVLFGCGRPTIVVPTTWEKPAAFDRIVIAWDGGARAARAVGDALPFLENAGEVEVVCVTSSDERPLEGSDLARHLSRHCRNLRLTDLPIAHGDAGRVLRDHLAATHPDLLVMGAFAHSRLLQFVLGGVTSDMLAEATLPVFYSY